MSLRRALTKNEAATDPAASDPRLRGRSYDIPFRRVWDAALRTAQRARGWTVLEADARAGEIRAEARTTLWRWVDDVQVRVTLDPLGLTRVDLRSKSRTRRVDLDANARRIARFLRALDHELGAA